MKKCFSIVKNYVIMIIGALLTALSVSVLLAPNRLASGGVSGLATVLFYVTGYPIGIIALTLNVPLFALGIRSEGKAFGAKSIYATVLLSFFIDMLADLPPLTEDILLASVFGGLLMGLGLGLVFIAGATTGGTDIVAKLVQNSLRHIGMGRLLLVVDLLVIMFAIIVFRDVNIGLYSIIALYASSVTIDMIIDGGKFAKTVFIISDKYVEIAQCIKKDLKRGVTGIYGHGMYSGQEKTILMCTLKRNQIPQLKDLVKENDSSAFLIFTDVREVLGEGFINYEGGKKIEKQ